MSIEVTVQFDSPESAIEGLSRLRGLVGTTSTGNPKPAPTPPAAESKPAAGKQPATSKPETPAPAASDTKATTPAPKPSPSPAPAPEPAPAPAEVKAPLYGESGIPELIQAMQKAKRGQEVKDLLSKFKAFRDGDVTKPSGQALKPEQFADFKAEIQALLDAPEESMA